MEHWKLKVIISLTKLSSLVAPWVVNMTTYGATSDNKVVKLTTFFSVRWCRQCIEREQKFHQEINTLSLFITILSHSQLTFSLKAAWEIWHLCRETIFYLSLQFPRVWHEDDSLRNYWYCILVMQPEYFSNIWSTPWLLIPWGTVHYRIPPQNSNLVKSHSSITSVSIGQCFWNFAQSKSASLPCSVQIKKKMDE